MSEFLNENILTDFRKDGVVCLRGVYDKYWIDMIRNGIDRNLQNPSVFSERLVDDNSDRSGAFFNDYLNWQSIPEFKQFILESPSAGIAGLLMNSKYSVFYHEHVLIKEANSGKETPWHTDQPYYPIDGFKNCSIWMPLDSVAIESTIEFAAGSHLDQKWYRPRKFATQSNYQNDNKDFNESEDKREYFDVPSDQYIRQNYNIVRYAVQPGDCIVFHMRTLHSAPGNLSKSTARRIFSTRWLGDDSVIGSRPWKTSPPITGGLKIGQNVIDSNEFPIVWKKIY